VFGPRNENEWFYLWQQGRWDEHKLHAYLDEWQHRFELFGDDEEGRFYQVKPQSASEAEILHAIVARDGGATLFNHETNADFSGISFAEAARTLLAAQCFRAGGRTKGSGTYLVQAPCLNRTLYY